MMTSQPNPESTPQNANLSDSQKIIVEQYKLYVEMADRTSNRRLLANSYYMTLHTAIYAAIWAFLAKEYKGGVAPHPALFAVPFLLLGVLCVVWYLNIRCYDQLNAKKFVIVGELEKKLPCQPWANEWVILERGTNRRVYWPLSHLERWIPVVMGICDLLTFFVIINIK